MASTVSSPFSLLVHEPQCVNEEQKLTFVRSEVSPRIQRQVWLAPWACVASVMNSDLRIRRIMKTNKKKSGREGWHHLN